MTKLPPEDADDRYEEVARKYLDSLEAKERERIAPRMPALEAAVRARLAAELPASAAARDRAPSPQKATVWVALHDLVRALGTSFGQNPKIANAALGAVAIVVLVAAGLGAAKAYTLYEELRNYQAARARLYLDCPVVFASDNNRPLSDPQLAHPVFTVGHQVHIAGMAQPQAIREVRAQVFLYGADAKPGAKPEWEATRPISDKVADAPAVPFDMVYEAPPDGRLRTVVVEIAPHDAVGTASSADFSPARTRWRVHFASLAQGAVAYVAAIAPPEIKVVRPLGHGQAQVLVAAHAAPGTWVTVASRARGGAAFTPVAQPQQVASDQLVPFNVQLSKGEDDTCEVRPYAAASRGALDAKLFIEQKLTEAVIGRTVDVRITGDNALAWGAAPQAVSGAAFVDRPVTSARYQIELGVSVAESALGGREAWIGVIPERAPDRCWVQGGPLRAGDNTVPVSLGGPDRGAGEKYRVVLLLAQPGGAIKGPGEIGTADLLALHVEQVDGLEIQRQN